MEASLFRARKMDASWKGACIFLVFAISAVTANRLGNLIEMEEYTPDSDPGAPYGTVWYNGSYLYLPAPPGKTPACARGGMTYCSSIQTYPEKVIRRLLIQWKYDLSTLFSNENRDTLTSGLAMNTSSPPPKTSYPSRKPSHYGHKTSAFRPMQIQPPRPISFQDSATPLSETASQDSYTVQMSGPGYLYSLTPSGRRETNAATGYEHQKPMPSYNPEQWGYSFAVNRQKRQASSGGQLCPTSGQYVTPKAGLNNRGEWRYVVNMGEAEQQYRQLVRTERCISNVCSGLCTIPAGMQATCEQQYVQKKMIGLDPSGSQMYTDLYWIPHCCVCQIR